MIRYKDMAGLVVGEITVLGDTGERDSSGSVKWLCRCSCGKEWYVRGIQLRRGQISCGCVSYNHPEGVDNQAFKHGHCNGYKQTPVYTAWCNMKRRCNTKHKDYGGRGITYCAEWESFDVFLEDMGDSYSDGLTLDRKDPNGNYCKENCRWIPRAEQARNNTKRINNKTGFTGVYFTENGYRASCRDIDGSRLAKFFSLSVYGEEAFALACQWREKTIEELNEKGAGYSEFHGKDKIENPNS